MYAGQTDQSDQADWTNSCLHRKKTWMEQMIRLLAVVAEMQDGRCVVGQVKLLPSVDARIGGTDLRSARPSLPLDRDIRPIVITASPISLVHPV
ncbi:hypothetical protein NUW54_g12277 [Trametes sanguinea]|uniref:Uncharacterized protein n=1 Tax=Trametes sanguinea TaxID=158606 RepID=A0ACC1N199_9APHY|nr:hypothetical protein NUW54_g12277 [Trametes sanguinea]